MLILIALGGNALLQRGQPLEAHVQRKNVECAAQSIAELIQAGHQLIITHGNGPQVGLLALQSEAYSKVSSYPFDVLNAESQSMIGYMLQQAIHNRLPEREVVTLITQIVVDAEDPAFMNPSKFIGPFYSEDEIKILKQKKKNWIFKEEGDQYRRVIASPCPKIIVELNSIKTLVEKEIIVICGGGGGIPVIQKNNELIGIEAVIDKDRTSALIAEALSVDQFIILTDVEGVYQNWKQSQEKKLDRITIHELEKMSFPEGTMGPKVTAAGQFVKNTGKLAAIGHLTQLQDIVNHQTGTQITR